MALSGGVNETYSCEFVPEGRRYQAVFHVRRKWQLKPNRQAAVCLSSQMFDFGPGICSPGVNQSSLLNNVQTETGMLPPPGRRTAINLAVRWKGELRAFRRYRSMNSKKELCPEPAFQSMAELGSEEFWVLQLTFCPFSTFKAILPFRYNLVLDGKCQPAV